MTETIWITGVAGFSGRHLLDYIRRLPESYRVVGLDRVERVSLDLDRYGVIDLNQPGCLDEMVREEPPNRVFHLAALIPPAPEAQMWKINVGGTINLLRSLASGGCKQARVLCTGSAAEYLANGSGVYDEQSPAGGESIHGRTKWAQTTVALAMGRDSGMPVLVVRPFNLVGPGLPPKLVAAELCRQFRDRNREKLELGNGAAERDFIDVRDAVRAYWMVAEKGLSGEIYNVCSGRPTKILEVVSVLRRLTGRDLEVSVDPGRLRRVDIDRVCGSTEKLRAATGWEPEIALDQSLRDMLEDLET